MGYQETIQLLFMTLSFLCQAGAFMREGIRSHSSCDGSTDARDIVHCAQGFGQNVTGGSYGSVYWVTSLRDNNQPGSLRHATSFKRPLWIVFKVSGALELLKPLPVASNKTLDGRGSRVVLTGNGLQIKNQAENIIILNLVLWRGRYDAIQIKSGAKLIWIDRCTIGRWEDGAIDVTRGASYVTISRTLFHHHNKVMLVGSQPDYFVLPFQHEYELQVSIHHNWFAGTTQRHPRVVAGRVHVYNNVFQNWTLYGIGVTANGQVYSERNIFVPGISAEATRTFDKQRWPGKTGALKSSGDVTLDNAVLKQHNPDSVFSPREFYSYFIQDPNADVLLDVAKQAGWKNVTLKAV